LHVLDGFPSAVDSYSLDIICYRGMPRSTFGLFPQQGNRLRLLKIVSGRDEPVKNMSGAEKTEERIVENEKAVMGMTSPFPTIYLFLDLEFN